MARRPFFSDEPMSRLAVWSSRFAWFALAVAALSLIIVRTGLLEIIPSLSTFSASLVFAALAILLGFASFVSIWRHGLRGLGRALIGIVLGAMLLAYPAYLGAKAFKLPSISDISTDTANPPRFEVLSRLRPRGMNEYPAANAALQRAAYPEIAPLQEDAPPRQVYDAISGVVAKRKWLVVDSQPPTQRGDGSIELVARTLIMGFRDDVVIRIRPVGAGTRVDIRSASRYGLHDFGSNAERVRALMDDIDEAIANLPEPRAEQPARRPQPARTPPANTRR